MTPVFPFAPVLSPFRFDVPAGNRFSIFFPRSLSLSLFLCPSAARKGASSYTPRWEINFGEQRNVSALFGRIGASRCRMDGSSETKPRCGIEFHKMYEYPCAINVSILGLGTRSTISFCPLPELPRSQNCANGQLFVDYGYKRAPGNGKFTRSVYTVTRLRKLRGYGESSFSFQRVSSLSSRAIVLPVDGFRALLASDFATVGDQIFTSRREGSVARLHGTRNPSKVSQVRPFSKKRAVRFQQPFALS